MFSTKKVDPDLLRQFTSQTGQSLAALSAERSLYLVFLRHFGCTFCREMVSDLAKLRSEIESQGPQLAFVHLGTEQKAAHFLARYQLQEVPRFSDPQARLYQAFGLLRAELRQYLNVESITRMLFAWMDGHFIGLPAEDIQRMPGVFVLENGEIRKSFRHKLVSDRPDYLALASAS